MKKFLVVLLLVLAALCLLNAGDVDALGNASKANGANAIDRHDDLPFLLSIASRLLFSLSPIDRFVKIDESNFLQLHFS